MEITDEDVESEIEFWKAGLILFVVGKELSVNALKHFISKVWNFATLPEIYFHDEGYFLVRFKSVDERTEMMQNVHTIFSIDLYFFVNGVTISC